MDRREAKRLRTLPVAVLVDPQQQRHRRYRAQLEAATQTTAELGYDLHIIEHTDDL